MLNRNYFIDNLKFFLIILVIFGHCIAPLKSNFIVGIFYNFIYTFHMPFFIIISGFFSKDLNPEKIKKFTRKIFETYMVFQIAQVSLKYLIGGPLPGLKSFLFFPQWTLWFLLSIVSWKILLYLYVKCFKNNKTILIISVLCSCFIGFFDFNGAFLSISRTIAFFPFFFTGYLLSKEKLAEIRYSKNYGYLIIPVVVVLFYFIPFIRNYDSFVYLLLRNKSYYITAEPKVLDFFLNAMTILFAFALSFSIFKFFPSIKSFEKLGSETLFFYLYHGLLVILLRAFFRGSNYLNLPVSLFSELSIFVLTMVLLLVMRKFKLFHFMLNPISNFIELGSSKGLKFNR